MPITASCGNCGKTYQAPDRMAGKNVRCKACGEVFRVDAPDGPPPGELDIDELERSFGGETVGGSMTGTQAAPTVDARGKIKVPRAGNVDEFAVSGEMPDSMRSNYRYRYPGAKQIDQFLPWVLIVVSFFVVIRSCLSTEANSDVAPPTGVGVSRAAILIALYVILIWPASHMALSMAGKKMRFSMPRAPLWRSFAGFTPVLMMGAGLYTLSGGETAGLVMGVFVGLVLAVGAVALLFRVFPNELPIVGGYAVGGAATGSAFAIALIIAANMVGLSIAKMSKEPTLFTSPIAIGLPWVDKPAPAPVAPVRKHPIDVTTAGTPGKTETPDANVPPPLPRLPGEAAMSDLPIPPAAQGELQFIRALESTPVHGNFERVVTTPVASNIMAVIRSNNGGSIETWDSSTFQQPTTGVGRDFDPGTSELFVNTTGRMVVRLVHTPTDRIEEIPLGNVDTASPAQVVGSGGRTLRGFLNDHELAATVRNGSSLYLETYNLTLSKLERGAASFRREHGSDKLDLVFSNDPQRAFRLTGDGKSILVTARDPIDMDSADQSTGRARLYRYSTEHLDQPRVMRNLPLNASIVLSPLSLSDSPDGSHVALLLNTAEEGYLTVWDVSEPKEETETTMPTTAPTRDPSLPSVDRRLGLLSSLRPNDWDANSDPVVWLDAHTLLLYGRYLHDADTGRRLGALSLTGIRGSLPRPDALGRLVLIQSVGGTNTLVRVTFDAAALKKAHG